MKVSQRRHAARFAALVLVAIAAFADPAAALDLRVSDRGSARILTVEGEFKRGDSRRLADAITRAGRVEEVWFNSPGGSLMEGIEAGRVLRRLGIAARVPDRASCASACVYALIGGIARSVDPGGKVGVHMHSMAMNPELRAEIAAVIRQYGEAGLVKAMQLMEQASAFAAAQQARYLVEMRASLELMTPTVSTEHFDIHWLTREELVRYNVVNVQ